MMFIAVFACLFVVANGSLQAPGDKKPSKDAATPSCYTYDDVDSRSVIAKPGDIFVETDAQYYATNSVAKSACKGVEGDLVIIATEKKLHTVFKCVKQKLGQFNSTWIGNKVVGLGHVYKPGSVNILIKIGKESLPKNLCPHPTIPAQHIEYAYGSTLESDNNKPCLDYDGTEMSFPFVCEIV